MRNIQSEVRCRIYLEITLIGKHIIFIQGVRKLGDNPKHANSSWKKTSKSPLPFRDPRFRSRDIRAGIPGRAV